MRKITELLLVFLFSFALFANAQAQQNYNDVVVIININSLVSDSAGLYFMEQRNIPDNHICYVDVATTEKIIHSEFEIYKNQVKTFLQSLPSSDIINYITTTKGCPLKINRGDIGWADSPSASCESELTLVNGLYENYIGGESYFQNPYFVMKENFNKTQYGFYIVTRLDGYDFIHDIKGLIDRATETLLFPSDAKFVFDQDPGKTGTYWRTNAELDSANSFMIRMGFNSILSRDTTFIKNQNNILGYASWGINDAHAPKPDGNPHNTYISRAIGETFVSTSARTFNRPVVYGQSVIADLIADGITGVKGYVYEPYIWAVANVGILFERYASQKFNLGESYYMASKCLSWMDVVIGDPKCLFKYSVLPIELVAFSGEMFSGKVILKWETATETNNYGFEIERAYDSVNFKKIGFVEGNGTTINRNNYKFFDTIKSSAYYRLKQVDTDGKFEYSSIIYVQVPVSFKLAQNYPNPFNLTTEIIYEISAENYVLLEIYNILGQKVATLVNENKSAGNYKVKFNAEKLASGIYFYKLQMEGFVETKKMILIK